MAEIFDYLTREKNSDTPQNKYEYVEKLLPSLEHTFNKVLNNLRDQEASHVELSTRATKQHHYDYKIGSLCFIKTPNIKSNLSPKLRPKFEGIFIFALENLDDLQPDETEVKGIVPSPRRFRSRYGSADGAAGIMDEYGQNPYRIQTAPEYEL
ncbi:hypothetical protein TNCV_391841 [Trichonephila clavipes]|nr:hypothetical protein TNCV_391841 [Trichonephila clavipes]